MTRITKAEKLSRLNSVVVLLRSTTWKCGRLEKRIVKQLHQLRQTKLKDLYRRLEHEDKDEVWDAIKRLQARKIIKIAL